MTTDRFESAKAELARLGGQRVWSLMVTLFGDLARSEGDTIRGPVLSAIFATMGIKPEAVRVALYRLRNDGWITSVKRGRTSNHSLSKFGREQSAAASARIYARPDQVATGWQLALLEDPNSNSQSDMLNLGFAPLMPRLYLGSIHARPVQGAAMLKGEAAPDWLRTQFEPTLLAKDYSALYEVLSLTEREIPEGTRLSAVQVAALRCLIVHNWRRIVLKHPDLPADLYSKTWAGPRCHQLVHTLLTRFPRPAFDNIQMG